MPERDRCPNCGAQMQANAPHGLCPACLLGQGLENEEPTVTHRGESGVDSAGGALSQALGKFLVIGRLGTGGQGSALLARDLDLGRLVVLKRYHASASSPGGDEVLRDGQALSRLRSRYVPQCYGIERSWR